MARSSKEPVPDPVVATVAGRPITLADVVAREGRIRRGPRGGHLPPGDHVPPGEGSLHGSEWSDLRRWIVQELVAEEVLAHEAARAGLETTRALVEKVTRDVTIADEDARAYYERNADLYRRPERRRIRHRVCADETNARRALERIGDADELEIGRGELAGALEDAVYAVYAGSVGSVVGPIRTEHGWHIARVEGVIPASDVPYDDARPAIEAELLAAARLRAFEAWLDARRQALAVVEPAFAHPGDPVHGLPQHRH